MDGSHTIERCEEVTGMVLHAVFHALFERSIALEGMLLKPNMILSSKECVRQASVEEVAIATLRCLRRHVPAAVTCYHVPVGRPKRTLSDRPSRCDSFSYGRALQDPALEAWHGRDENLSVGQQALYRRARSNGAACTGRDEMEMAPASGDDPPHGRDWRDD